MLRPPFHLAYPQPRKVNLASVLSYKTEEQIILVNFVKIQGLLGKHPDIVKMLENLANLHAEATQRV